MDWGTVGILAGVVTLEGFRRLPPGAVVLRRSLLGAWSVAASGIERGRWALVAWWPPLSCTVLLLLTGDARRPASDVSAALARARPWRRALDLLGALVLLALLAALPLGTARFGSRGFLGALALVLALAGATSAVSARARVVLGLPRRAALAALSPFAAPQAGERLLETVLAGTPRLAAIRALLPAARFVEWIRPAVYDAAARGAPDPELAAVLTPEMRAEVLAAPPQTPGADRYCPRCGASYRQGVACGNCDDVPLALFAP